MLSAAVAFRIVMAAAAAQPTSLVVAMIPAADAACRPVAQACFAPTRLSVRNVSTRTILLDWYGVQLSPLGKIGYTGIFPSRSLASGATVETRDPIIEMHVETVHTVRVAYHLEGERPRIRQHVSAIGGPSLRDAALAACMRCNGGAYGCKTADRGRLCTEASQCQGVCLFDRFEELPAPACTPGPNLRCPKHVPMGFRVGHCSELLSPVGCFEVLSKDDSPSRPIALPAAHIRECFDEAAATGTADVTESSRPR